MRALEAHAAAEADSLASYDALLARGVDPVARVLIQLVVEDERRHHEVLRHMIERLRDEQDGAAMPAANPGTRVDEETILTTRALIREEREGARYLRHLARQERVLHDDVYALLLETMARDSEKHEQILRYLLKRLESSRAA